MRVRPISPDLLVTELAERLARTGTPGRLRVAVDGPPAARPDALAEA
ncbi:uridine kinase, partial [Micromonospora aurantiaca]|nr:uridine kinase [Micromonospora aurantiaca]